MFERTPAVMGIVNVTPDSFSDGGRWHATDAAVEHALRLADEGADILDIGGESTRPYSTPVSADEELRRVLPVVERVVAKTRVPVSIDTSKAVVAEAALAAGAEIVNDVTGLDGDPRMIEVVVRHGAGVCAMHMRGTPANMQDDPRYDDVIAEIMTYLTKRDAALVAAGVSPERICLDAGIGFGKTHEHNLELVARYGEFHSLGRPLLAGHSRKGFIAKILGDKSADRTAGTLGVTLALALQGVQVVRVHDVRPTVDALKLFAASGALEPR